MLAPQDGRRSNATTLFNLEADYKYKHWTAQLDVLNLPNSKDHGIDYFMSHAYRANQPLAWLTCTFIRSNRVRYVSPWRISFSCR